MKYEAIGKLIDRWMEDASFREKMRKDPKGTLAGSGIKLTKEQEAVFQKINWKLSDEQLKAQANAFG